MRTVASVIRLTRWKEYVGFVIPLTVLGFLLAQRISGVSLGYKIFGLVIANFLSVAFAFMINDVEDAEDDLLTHNKARVNPISSKEVSKETGYFICAFVAIAAISIFVYIGRPVVWIGVLLIGLSFLYSAKPVRLKSWPVVDIISHSLMLGGFLMLSSFLAYSSAWGKVLYLTLAVCLFSAYGQIYNQVRDFEADKKAGLKNTTLFLGKEKSLFLSYLTLILAFILISLTIKNGLFPYWLGLVALTSIFLSKRFIRKTDLRGSKTVDFTGSLQVPANFVLNIVIFSWFAAYLLASLFR